jgi:predicted regulator of Ras-like GTPase activity (Roadblock/LC7/MglB family)
LSIVDELKKILADLNSSYGVEISAIVSRSGMPIAYNLPKDIHVETFATLSATLLGASEVVYTGLGKETPKRVVVESEGGNLIAVGLGKKAILVAMSSDTMERLGEGVEVATANIREVLRKESG